MGITHLPEQSCPLCGKLLDCAGTIDNSDAAPVPGDWTICAGCLQFLCYGPFMALRAVTNAEWLALSEEARTELTRQQRIVRAAFARRT